MLTHEERQVAIRMAAERIPALQREYLIRIAELRGTPLSIVNGKLHFSSPHDADRMQHALDIFTDQLTEHIDESPIESR
jgi:hypothetical protein